MSWGPKVRILPELVFTLDKSKVDMFLVREHDQISALLEAPLVLGQHFQYLSTLPRGQLCLDNDMWILLSYSLEVLLDPLDDILGCTKDPLNEVGTGTITKEMCSGHNNYSLYSQLLFRFLG